MTNVEAGEAIPTLGVSPEIDGALGSMKKNDVSQVLMLPANRLAIVVLNDRIPPRPADLNEVEGKVREPHRPQGPASPREGQGSCRQDERRRGYGQGGEIDEAGGDRIERVQAHRFGGGTGQRVYLEDAFTKPVGTVIGPINIMGRNVVYQVVDQQHVDPAKLRRNARPSRSVKSRRRRWNVVRGQRVTKLVAERKVKNNGRDQTAEASFR